MWISFLTLSAPFYPRATHATYNIQPGMANALQSHTSTEGMYLSTSSLGLHMKALVATTAAWVPVMGSVHVKRLEAQVVLDRHILCRHRATQIFVLPPERAALAASCKCPPGSRSE